MRVKAPCYGCKDNHAECKKTCQPFKDWDKADKEEKAREDEIKRGIKAAEAITVCGINRSREFARRMERK